jgi:hypothetical protein
MGKQGTSTTQNTYPQWLQQYLAPLIGGSTQKMGNFQNQGWEVLQGRDYKKAPQLKKPTRSRDKYPPGTGG